MSEQTFKITLELTEAQCLLLSRGLWSLEVEADAAADMYAEDPEFSAKAVAAAESCRVVRRAVNAACPSSAPPEDLES